MTVPSTLTNRLQALLMRLYPDHDTEEVTAKVVEAFWPEGTDPRGRARKPGNQLWSQKDALLITYGDSLIDGVYKPLDLLRDFLGQHLKGVVNGVHILPFFPFTSDDGFAVTDYRKVNPALGDWPDIQIDYSTCDVETLKPGVKQAGKTGGQTGLVAEIDQV